MTRDSVTVYDCSTCGTGVYWMNGEWVHFTPSQQGTHDTVVIAVILFTRDVA